MLPVQEGIMTGGICILCGERKPLPHVITGEYVGFDPDDGMMYHDCKVTMNYCHDCHRKIVENQKRIKEEKERLIL
jgi:hypothetical protein